MKITDLICEIYRWPRPFTIANGSNTYGDGVLLLLRVLTDQNITGHGWLGGTAAERPLEIFSSYIPFYKPVHALLSGDDSPKKVRAYIAGGYYYGDDDKPAGLQSLQDELTHNIQTLNAKSVKIKIGNPAAGIDVDTKRVAASREALGPNIELMVDANCAFKNAETAIAYAQAFEPYDIFWLEEPFRPDAFNLHRQLADATSIPIATGENIYTVPHFRELLSQGAVKWVNSDVAIATGGYDAGMDIWNLAKESGCHLAPHGCQELQCHYVAAADPDGRFEIYPPKLDPERDKIFTEPFALDKNGFATMPNEPGIGRIPNRDALKKHLVYTSENES